MAQKPTAFTLAEAGSARPEGIEIVEEPDFLAHDQAPKEDDQPKKKGFSALALFAGLVGAFLSLVLTVEAARFIEGLFSLAPWLGWFGLALGAGLVLALVIVVARQVLAVRRLARIESLRLKADAIVASDDGSGALALTRQLAAFYAADATTAAGRTALERLEGEVLDGRTRLVEAERLLLVPKDAAARAAIAATARRVSVVTAISPRAILDIAFVIVQAVGLIRTIADIYGGRSGGWGFWKLLGRVGSHLAITGGLAVTDSVLGQVVGAGLAARISAKLGEGVLNGVLTARVGLAAIAACRPLPFLGRPQPTLGDVAGNLFGETVLPRAPVG